MKVRQQRVLAAVLLLAGLGAPAVADTVTLFGKPPFLHVEIIGYRRGMLVFRGVSGETLRKPPAQIAWFAVDALPVVEAAERAVVERPADAIPLYEQAIANVGDDWLRDLLGLRLLATLDRAGRFGQAIELYLDLLERHVDGADEAMPRRAGPSGSDENKRARDAVVAARAGGKLRFADDALRRLLLELLLIDEVADLGPEFAASDESGPSTRSRSKRKDHRPGLMFGESKPTSSTANVVLGADSLVAAHSAALIALREYAAAARLIERALPYFSDEAKPRQRIQLARCQLESGDAAKAAADLLAMSENSENEANHAEALYYAGLAHERLDRPDVARKLYAEVLAGEGASESIRSQTEAALKRVGE